jgi:hypothetical protein
VIKPPPAAGRCPAGRYWADPRPVRRADWAAGALAVLSCLSACASSTPGQSSVPAPATITAKAAASAIGVDRTTPGATLADWLHRLVVADYRGACQDMAAGTGSATPTPDPSAAGCPSADTLTALKSLHGNFVADGLKPGSQFTVSAPKSSRSGMTS